MWKFRRLSALLLAGVLCLNLGACGNESTGPGYTVGGNPGSTSQSSVENTSQDNAGSVDQSASVTLIPNTTVGEITPGNAVKDGMVYVAEECKVTTTDLSDYFCMSVNGDKVSYGSQHTVISYPLDGGAMEMETMYWEEQTGTWSLRQLAFDNGGNVYAIVSLEALPNSKPYLCKFDPAGQNVYALALQDLLEETIASDRNSTSWSSSWELAVDQAGNVYFLAAGTILAFDEEGAYAGTVNLGNGPGYEVSDLTGDDEGTVYAVYAATGSYNSAYVGQIDFASLATVNVNKGQGIKGVCAGAGNLFLYTADTVYEYDMATAIMTPAFKWLECEVNSNYLQNVGVAEDGSLMAVTFDYNAMGEIQLIQKMTEEEAKAAGLLGNKTTITLAVAVSSSYIQQLTNAVAEFNKTNKKYSVKIENYAADAVDGESAENRLNNEIVAGKGPDLLAFGDFSELAKKRALVNLYDFLEISADLSKEDFFEKILEHYTVDGILTAIPQNFYLKTLVGSSDIVGEEMGWTLEELYALADQYPGQAIIGRGVTMTKSMVVRMLLEFNGELFLNEEAGTCNFNTEEFKMVLEFAQDYPTEYESNRGKPSIYTKLETGEILLAEANASGIREFQAYDEALGGKMTFIGYPTASGVGCEAQLNDAIAMNANSIHQEGAWAFLEFYLQYYDLERLSFGYGLPTNKVAMEKLAKLSMTDDTSSVTEYSDGWRFQAHKATQEEIDEFYALIENMQFVSVDYDIISIIQEEADSYFLGQKSLDTVIEIIQNRVQNYLDEQK